MSVNGLIWTMCLYVFVYYLLARDVLIELKRIDPGHFNHPYSLGAPVGMTTSKDIMRMLFDGELPRPGYSRYVRYGVWVSRLMLAGFVPVLVVLCVFFVHL